MQDNWISNHLFLYAGLLMLAIVAFWCFVVMLIALASGWRALARRFRAQQPFIGATWWWQSAGMRLTRYNACLTIGADPMGLFLHVISMFPGHPDLFIPWTEITVGSRPTLFGEYVQLRLGSSEQVRLTINPTLASRLQSTAGSSWPGGLGKAGVGHGLVS